MSRQNIHNQITIDGFPEKGSAIVSYFHDRGDITGYFYIGLVETSGKKSFKVRWWDGTCEIFTSIEGENKYYSYFAILAYISYENYNKLGSEFHAYKTLNDLQMDFLPCPICIRRFKEQNVKIREIKRANRLCPRTNMGNIGQGRKIRFIYVQRLDEPCIVEGFTRKKDSDNQIYANCDINLSFTEEEDEFYLVKKGFVLEC